VSTISPFVAVIQPEASGYIELASSDYRDQPLIHPNYYGSESKSTSLAEIVSRWLLIPFQATRQRSSTATNNSAKWSLTPRSLPSCSRKSIPAPMLPRMKISGQRFRRLR
jgi:hypothetical protein